MMNLFKKIILPLLIFVVLVVNCAGPMAPLSLKEPPPRSIKNYQYLEVANYESEIVGEINNDFMNHVMLKSCKRIIKKNRFRKVLLPDSVEIKKTELIKFVGKKEDFSDSTKQIAILIVSVIEYDKGNELLRFAIGLGAGSGKIGLRLTLVDKNTNNKLAEAETDADIVSMANEYDTVEPLSRATADFIDNQFRKNSYFGVITLNTKERFVGEFVTVENNDLYFAKDQTLYIINKARITSITEYGKKITFSELRNREFNKIRWGRYSETVTLTL